MNLFIPLNLKNQGNKEYFKNHCHETFIANFTPI